MQLKRPRRNRSNALRRHWRADTNLHRRDLVYPVFLVDGTNQQQEIPAMPGQFRWSTDLLLKLCERTLSKGVESIALFPAVPENLKNSEASESLNPDGLICQAIREVKKRFPELTLITDVALDPFSSDGHDGLVRDGIVLNDESVELMAQVASLHADCGSDIISASDMMDGRILAIREALDENNYTDTSILSYTAKYASSFYGPFRQALDSAPRAGDKKTYQMDPASSQEAILEAELDEEEGADILMVKPALSYLDVIQTLKDSTLLPVAAYNVSGEYSMVKAAASQGWLNEAQAVGEILLSIKRAGASVIFTYFALDDFNQ